jgi:hypothetical protein
VAVGPSARTWFIWVMKWWRVDWVGMLASDYTAEDFVLNLVDRMCTMPGRLGSHFEDTCVGVRGHLAETF